jgi:hypothetical protein
VEPPAPITSPTIAVSVGASVAPPILEQTEKVVEPLPAAQLPAAAPKAVSSLPWSLLLQNPEVANAVATLMSAAFLSPAASPAAAAAAAAASADVLPAAKSPPDTKPTISPRVASATAVKRTALDLVRDGYDDDRDADVVVTDSPPSASATASPEEVSYHAQYKFAHTRGPIKLNGGVMRQKSHCTHTGCDVKRSEWFNGDTKQLLRLVFTGKHLHGLPTKPPVPVSIKAEARGKLHSGVSPALVHMQTVTEWGISPSREALRKMISYDRRKEALALGQDELEQICNLGRTEGARYVVYAAVAPTFLIVMATPQQLELLQSTAGHIVSLDTTFKVGEGDLMLSTVLARHNGVPIAVGRFLHRDKTAATYTAALNQLFQATNNRWAPQHILHDFCAALTSGIRASHVGTGKDWGDVFHLKQAVAKWLHAHGASPRRSEVLAALETVVYTAQSGFQASLASFLKRFEDISGFSEYFDQQWITGKTSGIRPVDWLRCLRDQDAPMDSCEIEAHHKRLRSTVLPPNAYQFSLVYTMMKLYKHDLYNLHEVFDPVLNSERRAERERGQDRYTRQLAAAAEERETEQLYASSAGKKRSSETAAAADNAPPSKRQQSADAADMLLSIASSAAATKAAAAAAASSSSDAVARLSPVAAAASSSSSARAVAASGGSGDHDDDDDGDDDAPEDANMLHGSCRGGGGGGGGGGGRRSGRGRAGGRGACGRCKHCEDANANAKCPEHLCSGCCRQRTLTVCKVATHNVGKQQDAAHDATVQLLNDAIGRGHQTVWIRYEGGSTPGRVRPIEPTAWKRHPFLFTASSIDQGGSDVKTYRVDRISKASLEKF